MWTPEKRQRVAHACDRCKRRKKQVRANHKAKSKRLALVSSLYCYWIISADDRASVKCSGNHPCATCTSKSMPCSFSGNPTRSGHSRHAAEKSFDFHKISKRNPEPSRTSTHESPHVEQVAGTDAPAEDSAPEDETPIQNPGRLLQDREGRLGKWSNWIFTSWHCYYWLNVCQYTLETRQPYPSYKVLEDLSKKD